MILLPSCTASVLAGAGALLSDAVAHRQCRCAGTCRLFNVTGPLCIIIESLFMRFGTTTLHTRACELTQIKCPIFGHNFWGY